MKRNEFHNCLLCHAPLNEQATWKTLLTNAFSKTICSSCEQTFEFYENNEPDIHSLYKYNEAMNDYLHRYKFMHDVLLAKVFREQIQEALSDTKTIIIPIPMHPAKLVERTFSHVDELLIAANVQFEHYLEKISTETQASKSREERINSPQLFQLRENTIVENKQITLVDDIYTTGTTIAHASNVLMEAGAKSVKAFTLIRA